ncbi:N-6 DNA methylase [Rhodococcus rhodochrous]|uniref:N-6 DNA methylase n=1 Tax=Rhodococcus rhodochrous TaxID=1829 RepID=UPI000E737CF4
MTTPPAGTISTAAIAELLGVTRATITNWKSRKNDFPEPVAGTVRSPLYDRQEIIRWLIANDKATERQLRGLGMDKIVFQLLDMLRSYGLSTDLLGAAICYVHLSRSKVLPRESCFGPWLTLDELVRTIDTADSWACSSSLTHRLPIFGPLIDALDKVKGSKEVIFQVLRQIDEVEDLDALHTALISTGLPGKHGEGSLPDEVSTFVAQLVPRNARRIFDPFCMSGSLAIVSAQHHPGADVVVASPYRGPLESTVRWTLIAGIKVDVIDGDILDDAVAPDVRADAVVCNAPWGMKVSGRSRSMIRDTDPRWVFGTPRGDLHWALVQDAIYRLEPGGRAVLLCPKAALFTTTQGAGSIREGLLRQGCVEAVIATPPGLLHHTGIGFCILVLTRPGEAADTENVLLIDVVKPTKRGEQPDFPSAVRAYRKWLSDTAVDADSEGVFRAPVREILAPLGSLDPSKWREAANRPDTHTLTASLGQAQQELENALAMTATIDPRWTPQAGRVSRYATIGSLSDIAIHRGVPLDRRVLDADADTGVPVLSLAVLNGRAKSEDIRYVDLETVRGKPVLTEPGDVVAHPTPSGIVVTVWNKAGWLPNSHAEILRITDPDAFDPEFLVLCLSSRLITDPVTVGSIVPRAQSKNVTIPLIPIADQRSIVAYQRQIDTVAAYGHRLTRAADELERALADAAASGFTMTRP